MIELTPEVSDALAERRAVVALESTIISHGMPYPQNVAMATEVEGIVREHGAVPATIAVLDGVPKVGLGPHDLERLGRDPSVVKASVRDLPAVIARGGHGATTVAATMRLASLAGIRVFVTGGLGGVHRGAATSFDVSADLTELSRTPVCVVCAGVKSILDIGLTLEQLETLGVPVLVDGSDEFPSFYSRGSGFPAPLRVDGPDEIARAMDAAWSLGLTSGLVVAHPVPEAEELPAAAMGPVIAQALSDLDERGIRGRDATPYLLGRIVELTDGRSLTANIALVRENARVGAQIAVKYADLLVAASLGHHDDMSTSPFDDANEADVAEQQRSATNRDDDDTVPTPPTVPTDQANEADVLEQGAEVGDDDDEYDR